MTEREELNPCPFCGGLPDRIEPVYGPWNGGMRPQSVICYRLFHYCHNLMDDNFVTSTIEMRARTEEQMAQAWNRRAEG